MRLTMGVAAVVLALACDRPEPGAAPQVATAIEDVVMLDSLQLRQAGIRVGRVGLLPADTITLSGTITFDAARLSHVGPRIQGRIQRVPVDIGARVAAGDTLAVLDSPELGSAQARWVQARVMRDLAARNFERAERLFRDGIVSQRRRLESEAELRERDASLTAALQALSALGAEPDSTGSSRFVIRSPLSGEVVEKHATAGEVVGPESSLFVVGALDRVWLLLDAYEADLHRVRAGAPVSVAVDAFPDRRFAATAALISAVVDTVSRTVKVRVEIPNADHRLKPGMFARAAMAVTVGPGALGVPAAAVQSLGGRSVVFVPTAASQFRAHPVTVGRPQAGGWVEVVAGLRRGDSVVTAGSFTLKAHLQRGAGEEP